MIRKLKTIFTHNESDTFKTKVKKGVVWTSAISFWSRGMGLISAVIITRILNPDDFGMMAVASAIMAIIAGLTQSGFSSAVIQKQVNPKLFLNSAWTMELIRGFILFILVLLLAPTISRFYNEERLCLMLRVLSLTFLLMGMQNIGVIWFRKDLDMRKEFVFSAIPDIFYLIIVFTILVLIIIL